MKVTDSKSTIQWYDVNAKQYSFNIQNFPPPQELIEKFIDYVGGKTIIDAGCAGGRDSAYFSEQGYDVTGIDLSGGLIKVATSTYPKLRFIQADMRELPFEDELFDGVWAQASLVHMHTNNDAEAALQEFHRVLKNNGILYVSVKTGNKETDVVSDKLSGHKRFFRYYSESEMEQMLTQSGFDILAGFPLDDPAGRDDVKWIVFFARKARD